MNDKIYILAMLNLICKKLKIESKDVEKLALDIEIANGELT